MTGEIAVAQSANAMLLLSGLSVLVWFFKGFFLSSLCNNNIFIIYVEYWFDNIVRNNTKWKRLHKIL